MPIFELLYTEDGSSETFGIKSFFSERVANTQIMQSEHVIIGTSWIVVISWGILLELFLEHLVFQTNNFNNKLKH